MRRVPESERPALASGFESEQDASNATARIADSAATIEVVRNLRRLREGDSSMIAATHGSRAFALKQAFRPDE